MSSTKTQRSEVSQNDTRALRALEKRVIAPASQGGEVRVHLTYPNTYWIGMSNLGFQAVYALFSKEQGISIDRAFLPEEHDQERLSGTTWRTFENSRLLADCDMLAFSLSFETDYPHLLSMLANAGLLIPSAEEREQRADSAPFGMPLLIAGGTSVTLNPEPVADLLDVIVLGEAEELIPEFVAVLRSARREGWPRLRLLKELAQIEGVYVPRFYSPRYLASGSIAGFDAAEGVPARPVRRFVKDLSKFPTYSAILTPETEFKSMFLTETGRGCEMGCRFCVAGYIYRPVRKRSEESLSDTVKIGVESSEAVGFVGAAVSSHRAISKLAKSVADSGGRASLSSIMSQKVSQELAASLSESEYKTVALAPEAGNERLRRAAGKRVSNEQVITAARELAEAGIRGFKLYFIVGLPTETDQDTDSIAHLAIAVRDAVVEAARASKDQGGNAKPAWVSLSVNPFIPKASTPFQWEPMLDRKQLERKIDRVRSLVKRVPNIELRFESPRESYFQALLSRGDRRVSRYLLRTHAERKDWKWLMQNRHEELSGKVPPIAFYVERRIPFDEALPWEIVDSRIDRELLKREAMRAHLGEQYGRGAELESPIVEGDLLWDALRA